MPLGPFANQTLSIDPSLLHSMTMTAQKAEKEPHEFIKQSSLYQEFLAEREEILKHKWIESERLGYDVGFERALLDWIRKHRESWRVSRRQTPAHTGPENKKSD